MFMPFQYGERWYCTQGQGGSFTHQGKLYYAFDFNKGSSLRNEDNPAYGARIYSPVTGRVIEIRDGVSDFSNNYSSNIDNNYGWGNTVVIRDERYAYYVRFAHMKFASTDHLCEGDWIEQGDYIGEVGQTGHSTSPHLHIQIMTSRLGNSRPFTFAEGKLYSYEWIKSSLMRNVSMLDNNGEISLSNDFFYGYTVKSGSWIATVGLDGYAGKNYQRKRIQGYYDSSYFEWRFKVKRSGWYTIYVTYPGSYSNERYAKYYLNGRYIRSMDQTRTAPLTHYLTTKYLSSSQLHKLRVKGRTWNKYLIADAIVLRKL
ncbi:peptidoglycan DD-metalloendopeptidase family protein [bacterium]|nr:peptidoglycan DD-metalloendopeptidase family protein [bacterium]